MIVSVKALIAALDPKVKLWAQVGCSRRLLYRVIAGRRITRDNALPFIEAAREQFGCEVNGVEVGGEIHYAPEALNSFKSRIAELEAENTRLRADNVTLSRIAYRRILVGGFPQN